MLKELKKIIKTTEARANTDFWLSNESCNKLIEEAESIQVIEDGVFELKFNSGETVGIKTAGIILCGDSDTAHVRMLYMKPGFKAKGEVMKFVIL